MNKESFLEKYNLKENDLEEAGLTWEELEAIYEDYSTFKAELEPTANYIVDRMKNVKIVHSTKMRIKDPERLIEKIIRKNRDPKNADFEKKININNYKTLVTDLIGIRALHLFKEDWRTIDEYIKRTWDLNEKPTIYIRKGDSDNNLKSSISEEEEGDSDNNLKSSISEEEEQYLVKEHEYGYRSVHYLVKSNPAKDTIIAEIQVRTVFEEGWSEIDHKFRYHNNIDDNALGDILGGYLMVFNRLAGSVDETASFLLSLKNDINRMQNKYKKEIEESRNTITGLKQEINSLQIEQHQKDKLIEGLKTLESPSPTNSVNVRIPRSLLEKLTFNELYNSKKVNWSDRWGLEN